VVLCRIVQANPAAKIRPTTPPIAAPIIIPWFIFEDPLLELELAGKMSVGLDVVERTVHMSSHLSAPLSSYDRFTFCISISILIKICSDYAHVDCSCLPSRVQST
jgi:hypothetical protein